jgi:alpha-tubulin suppressor-like RCC1 family protein
MSFLSQNRALAVLLVVSAALLPAQETRMSIAAGDSFGVLLKADGTVWTWGANSFGQLGRDDDDSWEPVQVPGLTSVRSIAAGGETGMALKSDGSVWTWGYNRDGQLGNGTTKNSPHPILVNGLPAITAISAGSNHSMALDATGKVWGWGAVPNRSSVPRPQEVPNLSGIVAIAAGDNHGIALDAGGRVWVWGDHGASNNFSNTPQAIEGWSDITALAGGYQLTLGLKKDGTVWAVGYGAAGQLGNGSTQNSLRPVMVGGLAGVKAISAHYMTAVALKNDGTVWSWGSNHYGQLGNPRFDSEDSSKPIRAEALTDVVAMAAAGSHTAALTRKATVWTWGQNAYGELGADPEALHQSDIPMHPGQSVPAPCEILFSCVTAVGRTIQVCGTQADDVSKWSNIHYRFGPMHGPPELMYPADPENAPPSLFYSEEVHKGEHYASIRFTNGAYTYRVLYALGGGGEVEVSDARGKVLSSIPCAERPYLFDSYLKENLPCDTKNPNRSGRCGSGK